MLRRAAALAAVSLLALAGCASESEPRPAWTEEEAYAEAERVYREYDAALAAFYEGREGDEADTTRFMTGEALVQEEEARAWYVDSGYEHLSKAPILSFEAQEFFLVSDSAEVHALACHDASELRVMDGEGNESNPYEEEGMYAVELEFVTEDDDFFIAHTASGDVSECR